MKVLFEFYIQFYIWPGGNDESLELLAAPLAACCMLATWTLYIKATMVWQSLETCILKSSRSKAARL